MVEFEAPQRNKGATVVGTFKQPFGSDDLLFDLRNQMGLVAEDFDLNIVNVDQVGEVKNGTLAVGVEMAKTSIDQQTIEDIERAFRAFSGFHNLWVICDNPEDHPEIYR